MSKIEVKQIMGLMAFRSSVVTWLLLRMCNWGGGGAYFAGDLEKFQSANLYHCSLTNIYMHGLTNTYTS
jgi:hypothetical protein